MLNILGFNLTSITAKHEFHSNTPLQVKTDLSISDVKQDSIPNNPDQEIISLQFSLSAAYAKKDAPSPQKPVKEKKGKQAKLSLQQEAQVAIEGKLILSLAKEEAALFQDSWKKKELPEQFKLPIYNFILAKCSIKALQLEEDLNLPPHFPLPQLSRANQEAHQKAAIK